MTDAISKYQQSRRCVLLVALFLMALAPAAADGVISYLEGSVTVRRGENAMTAGIGTEVRQGDVVATGARSTAVIRLANAADIKLRENSSVDLSEIGDRVEVGLNQGGLFARVFARLLGGFDVRADTVVGGVRGTEFFVAYGRTIEDLPDVWLCVNSGEVEVSVLRTGASMVVREGEGVNILAGTRLTDARRYRWTERLNWNMDPAEGALFDETDLDAAYSDLLDQDYD
ncbi:MAG: hypothetical protein EA384_03050 [Spirochaetaceae bacterium]|nr:MAG: hypothetical protein EA384_03050 [Spirochaetaceae bacterium]